MNVLLIFLLLRVFGRRISEVFKELVVDPLMQQEKGGLGTLKNRLQVVQKLHDIVEGALHLQQGLQARREFLQLNDVHIVMMKLLRLDARAMLDGRVKMLVIVNLTHWVRVLFLVIDTLDYAVIYGYIKVRNIFLRMPIIYLSYFVWGLILLVFEYLVNDKCGLHLRLLPGFGTLRLLCTYQHFLVPLYLYFEYSVLLLHLRNHTHVLGLSLLDGFDAALHDDLFSINLWLHDVFVNWLDSLAFCVGHRWALTWGEEGGVEEDRRWVWLERRRVGESWLLGWGHQEGGEALLGVQSALTSMNTSLVTENVPPLSLPLKLSAHLLVAFGHRPYLLLSRPYLRLDSACLFSQRLFFLHPIPMPLHGLTGGQLLHALVGFA
jgi:hypothetical protein